MATEWIGPVPTHCDLCNAKIKDQFTDGKTIYGSWANMCFLCAFDRSVGTGTGKGQTYKKKGKRWIKVGG